MSAILHPARYFLAIYDYSLGSLFIRDQVSVAWIDLQR